MKPARNLIKDAGRLVFWFPVRWVVQALPFGVLYRLGGWVGRLDRLLSGRGRIDRMERNIASGLGCDPRRARQALNENLIMHARNMLEFLTFPRMNAAAARRWVEIDGAEHLDRERQAGRGVLLCTAHFGAKQMLQVALGHAGYSIAQINYHLEPEALSWVQRNVSQRQRMRIEEAIPCRFISAKGFLRDAFRLLKEGRILIVAADGAGRKEDMDDSFKPLPFLGKTMRFPTNYVSLAQRTGAALVPCFTVRDGLMHRVELHPPLVPETAVQDYVKLLEDYVRRYPHLWEFWEEFEEGELLAPTTTASTPRRGRASISAPE